MINKNLKIVVFLIFLAGCLVLAFFLLKNKNIENQNNISPVLSEEELQAKEEQKRLTEDSKEIMKKIKKNIFQPVKEINKDDYILGDINLPVQLIIYADFDCPFFSRLNETLNKIKQEFSDKVVIAFRHFPQRIHSYSLISALASECAGEQNKFWQMYDKLLDDKKNNKMSKEQFKKDAIEIGLDFDKFTQCLDEKKYEDKINKDIIEADSFGVIGTPTMFVNGQQIPGAAPFDDYAALDGIEEDGMKSVIEKHLNK